MFEQLAKIKRQIEIVGLSQRPSEQCTVADIADAYGCEDLTVKRDLGDLRRDGIDIHSKRNRGVFLHTPLPRRRVGELLTQYLALAATGRQVDKATALLVRAHREQALTLAVTLQRAIERATVVMIDYEKEDGVIERARAIEPMLLFESDAHWRVLARNDGIVKQYHLTKIRSARDTAAAFVPVPQEEIDAMFRFSFRSWIGTERYRVRIRLSAEWARRIKPRLLMESQVITEHADGSVDFETTVNSLSEIAGWIVSRGEGVAVLEPEELRRSVIGMAQGALRNYPDGME